MPPKALHPLRRRFLRFQIRAQARPVRTAVLQGLLSGVLFGLFWFLVMRFGPLPSAGETSTAWDALSAVVSGVLFGLWMGLWFSWYGKRLNPEPLSADTEAWRVAAARKQLERGQLGQDPEVDRATVYFAGQVSRTPWPARTMAVLFVLMAALNWWLVLVGEGSWIHYCGGVMFTMGSVSVVLYTPVLRRRRATAERILAEAEHGRGPDPSEGPGDERAEADGPG